MRKEFEEARAAYHTSRVAYSAAMHLRNESAISAAHHASMEAFAASERANHARLGARSIVY